MLLLNGQTYVQYLAATAKYHSPAICLCCLARATAGFYCPAGAVTSDPFRNDTTLRPYPCSPGSYCLGGVGFSEVRVGDYLYAQTCPAGFFCETARYIPSSFGMIAKPGV